MSSGGVAVFEEEDDGLGAIRGCVNVFIFMVLVGLIIGYIWKVI